MKKTENSKNNLNLLPIIILKLQQSVLRKNYYDGTNNKFERYSKERTVFYYFRRYFMQSYGYKRNTSLREGKKSIPPYFSNGRAISLYRHDIQSLGISGSIFNKRL